MTGRNIPNQGSHIPADANANASSQTKTADPRQTPACGASTSADAVLEGRSENTTPHQVLSHALFKFRINSEKCKFDYLQTSYLLLAAFSDSRSFPFSLWEEHKNKLRRFYFEKFPEAKHSIKHNSRVQSQHLHLL